MPVTKGKLVAITGASSGLGEATALLFAHHGAKVVLGAMTNPEMKAQMLGSMNKMAIPPDAIARAIAFAID